MTTIHLIEGCPYTQDSDDNLIRNNFAVLQKGQ